MSLRVQVTESPSVVWKTDLPHVNRICTSPAFSLNNIEVYWTISGYFSVPYNASIERGYEYWQFRLKSESTEPDTGVAIYMEKTNGELKRTFVGEIGSEKKAFTIDRPTLSKIGITDDTVTMIFVFNCHSRCSKDMLEDPGTTKFEETHSKHQSQPERPSIHTPCLQDFCDNIETLFNNQEYSDAVLKCGDRSFSVNRNILSARSEVFAAMFRNKMSENQSGMVEITDMESSVLEKFLRFVYCGRLDAVTMESVFDLYKSGDKYAVASLQRKCASFILDNLSGDNVCQVLLLTDTLADTELLDVAIDFAVSRVGFLGSAAWNDFAKEHPASAVKVYQKFHTK